MFTLINYLFQVETITFWYGVYTGMIRNGKQHGLGTCKWNDGSIYVGSWENGNMHGYGVRLFSNGNMYIVQW